MLYTIPLWSQTILPSVPIVIKCQCYYYSGMVRPTDQERIITENWFVSHSSQEEETCRTTWGRSRISKEAEGMGEPMAGSFVVLPREGMGE